MISLKINIKIIRILILIFVCLVLVIAGTNFYNTVRTPFSGTTYLPLPSNFYIFDDLSIPMPDGTDSTDNRIFIPRGSFLISVNGIFLDSLFSEKDSLKAISKMSDLIGNSSDTLNLGYLTRSNNNYMAEIISQHYYRSFIKSVKISRELADKLPVNFLPDGILLGYIEKNGATYSAGIQSGDILIAVNGEPWKVIFSELEQSYRLDDKSMKALRSNPIGEPIYYNILRDGRIKSFEVRLAAFGVPINLLLGLILGILFVTFGSFLT